MTSSKFVLIIVSLIALTFASITASFGSQDVQKIAAIINDEIVSEYDVQQRLNLINASAGVKAEGEELDRMRAQVLRNLVDETLKVQESQRLEVKIRKSDVDKAVEDMAARNNLTSSQITELMKQSGVDIRTLRRQIVADLAWDTMVRGRFSGQVSVSDDEIDSILARSLDNVDKPQFLVSEIFLRVDTPDNEQAVLKSAEGLIAQLRSGAPFVALAQQFSQGASAAQGGDVGWVQAGELAPDLEAALVNLSPGQISAPIRTISGYYILALRNRRIIGGVDPMLTRLTFRQWVFPIEGEVPPQAVAAAANAIGRDITQKITSCEQAGSLSRSNKLGQLGEPRKIVASQLPDGLRSGILALEQGKASPPFRSQEGLMVIVLCDKQEQQSELPERADIENRLINQQVSMMARRYLRDLRNDAIVELR